MFRSELAEAETTRLETGATTEAARKKIGDYQEPPPAYSSHWSPDTNPGESDSEYVRKQQQEMKEFAVKANAAANEGETDALPRGSRDLEGGTKQVEMMEVGRNT